MPTPAAPPSVCLAIRKHEPLELRVRGEELVVEPYVHGWDGEGREVLRAAVVAGSDGGGVGELPPELADVLEEDPRGGRWRVVPLDAVEAAQGSGGSFVPRLDFDPDDPELAHVHCAVEPATYTGDLGGAADPR